jgi:hypothetical protein
MAHAGELALPAALPEGARSEAVLDALPGKRPLIKLSYRPPNYETPIENFRDAITANDTFFVRYHLSDIPDVDAAKWRVQPHTLCATRQEYRDGVRDQCNRPEPNGEPYS